jgi:hypothetical protein
MLIYSSYEYHAHLDYVQLLVAQRQSSLWTGLSLWIKQILSIANSCLLMVMLCVCGGGGRIIIHWYDITGVINHSLKSPQIDKLKWKIIYSTIYLKAEKVRSRSVYTLLSEVALRASTFLVHIVYLSRS